MKIINLQGVIWRNKYYEKNSIYFYVICLGVSIYNGMGRIFE